MEFPAIGKIKKLRIGHDNTGAGPGWYLDKVIVDDLDKSRVYEFPCYRWFATNEDDGQLFRDLLPGVGPDAAPPGTHSIHIIHTMNVHLRALVKRPQIFNSFGINVS